MSKIITISIIVLIAAVCIFFEILSKTNSFKFYYPESTGGMIIFHMAVNAAVFGICVVFGMITSSKVSKREL